MTIKRTGVNDRFPFSLKVIMFLGLIIRLLFYFKGGQIYYGTANFYLMGDTHAWFNSFLNLLHHGVYTSDLAIENGKFFRPPGYAFIMGIVYLICMQQTSIMHLALIGLQVSFDVFSIYLVYSIAMQTSANRSISLIAAILYAFYPFTIVWVPVLYAESFSVFFMLASFYYFSKDFTVRSCFLSALFLGLASLTRLQCLPLYGVLVLVIMIVEWKRKKSAYKYVITYSIAFAISYGLWPLRNYFLHDRLVFTEDVNTGGHWSPDFLSFTKFLTAVQVDIEPQRMQIIRHEKVTWPLEAILDKSDSQLLDSLSNLCKRCGTGFSHFRHTRFKDSPIVSSINNCDSLIETGFTFLLNKQKESNKINFYLKVPLANLQKAFLKLNLTEKKSLLVKSVSYILFSYRFLLLILGLGGIYFAYINKALKFKLLLAVLLYTSGWYFYVCYFFRHIEIRYFLHADILLLFPAAYMLTLLKPVKIFIDKTINAKTYNRNINT